METMTPEEFKEEMAKIRDRVHEDEYFDEYAHGPMDDLMCNLLRSLGYGAGIDIFDEQPKWYE